MYILQNALKNLVRNKGRNIMIGTIIFAIVLTSAIALVINNTAAAVIDDYKSRFSSQVYIQPDMQKLQEEAMKNATGGRVSLRQPTLSTELYLQFADSEYLKESILTGSTDANSTDIRAIDQSEDEDDSESAGGAFSASGGVALNSMRIGGGNFRLLGDSWQEFSDGLRALESGDYPQNENECLVSADLRDAEGLQIGDVLHFNAMASIDFDPEEYPDLEEGDTIVLDGVEYTAAESFMGGRATREIVYTLTITGVYHDLTDAYANENMPKVASLNRRNEILTTLPTLLAERNTDETGIMLNTTYYLLEPDMLSAFEAEVRGKGLPDTFAVSTDSNTYDRVVKPVLGLKSISITFMIVVIVLGAVILLLLASISIRERKYEIGVLRAMGMKKSRVGLGLWSELLMITCICLVVGLGAGMAVAQPVSDRMLESQVAAAAGAENQPQGGPGGGMVMMARMVGGGGSSNAKPLSEMEISLDLVTVLEIIGISILLASAAGLVSISKITQYEPIKILMERN